MAAALVHGVLAAAIRPPTQDDSAVAALHTRGGGGVHLDADLCAGPRREGDAEPRDAEDTRWEGCEDGRCCRCPVDGDSRKLGATGHVHLKLNLFKVDGDLLAAGVPCHASNLDDRRWEA